jgi:hypothetical protein
VDQLRFIKPGSFECEGALQESWCTAIAHASAEARARLFPVRFPGATTVNTVAHDG